MGQKGGAFEREFCGLLSLWWSDNATDDLFWRSATSGARATTRRKKGKDTRGHCGDICATDDTGTPLLRTLTVELKRGYPGVNLSTLLDGPEQKGKESYAGFIRQAVAAAKNAGTPYWLLVHRRDKRKAMAFMPWDLVNKIGGLHPKPNNSVLFVTEVDGTRHTIFGLHLTDWFQHFSPDLFKSGGVLWTPKKSSPRSPKT
jgi:hypothetical protein